MADVCISTPLGRNAYAKGQNIAQQGFISRDHFLPTISTQLKSITRLSFSNLRHYFSDNVNADEATVYQICSQNGMRETYNKRLGASDKNPVHYKSSQLF